MPNKIPVFPEDFTITPVGNMKYYSYETEGYEIAVEPEISFCFTVAKYNSQMRLLEPKVTTLMSVLDINKAIEKLCTAPPVSHRT